MGTKHLAMIRTGWLPTRQANGIQTIRMCEAFSALGIEVTLYYIPSSVFKDEIVDFYKIKEPITLRPLPRVLLPMRKSFKLQKWASFPSFVHALIWSAFVTHMVCREGADFYFARNPILAWWLARRGVSTVVEMHDLPLGLERIFVRRASRERSIRLIIGVTEHLRVDLVNRLGIPPEKTIALHDGVDLETFGPSISKDEARTLLELPLDRPLVVYAGQLYPEKGVDTLVEASLVLDGVEVIIVGGMAADAKRLAESAQQVGLTNVSVKGYVRPFQVPLYLRAADVLVLPISAISTHSAYYTSPLKLFEYMASQRPVVASRLPGLEEVLSDGENALLFPPGDPVALGSAINRLLSNQPLCARLSMQAYQDVRSYSWESRANKILQLIDPHI